MSIVILDTNCLIVSIPQKSKYRKIWTAFLSGNYVLAFSNEILTEYEEVLSDFYSPELATYVLETIINAPNIIETNIFYKWQFIQIDKDDNKFSDCYVASGADILVTEDKHFNILKNIDFPHFKILNINEFLELL